MRVVTLNLDVADAEALRQALGAQLAGCGCPGGRGGAPCGVCEALAATAQELERLLRRPRLGRVATGDIGGPLVGQSGYAEMGGPGPGRPALRLVRSAAEA
jgi:hypothetical protein